MNDSSTFETRAPETSSSGTVYFPTIAVMAWRNASSPPMVTLSFDGLDEPQALFNELLSIGWSIPNRPSPPASAIEWVPDHRTGADYTLRPWKVERFALEAGSWRTEDLPRVNAETFVALRRYAAEVGGNERLLGELAQRVGDVAVVPPAQAAAPGAPTAAHTPGAAPQVVVFGFTGEPGNAFQGFDAVTGGRKRQTVNWVETSLAPEVLCPDDQRRAELLAACDAAWVIHYPGPTPAIAGGSPILALIPGIDPGDGKLGKLVSMLGSGVIVGTATSLDRREASRAAFVYGSVPTASAELVSSNLRLRFKQAVLRS